MTAQIVKELHKPQPAHFELMVTIIIALVGISVVVVIPWVVKYIMCFPDLILLQVLGGLITSSFIRN